MMKSLSRGSSIIAVIAALMASVLLSLACSTDFGDNVVVTGTVAYVQLEGGFYGIKGDDGKSYDPVNLPAGFCKDGLRVRFEAKELKDQMSFHMWGTIVQIVHIQTL